MSNIYLRTTNPKIDMETPKIKSVEEVVKQFSRLFTEYGMTPSTTDNPPEGYDDFTDEPESVREWLRTTLTQDRASIHTSLVAAVEGLMQEEHPTEDGVPVETYGYEETHNQALKQVLTIINSIFKE